MKRLEYILNLIFYWLFNFEDLIDQCIRYPISVFLKLSPAIESDKRHYGKNAEKNAGKAFHRQQDSFKTILADRLLMLLLYFCFAGTLNFSLGFGLITTK